MEKPRPYHEIVQNELDKLDGTIESPQLRHLAESDRNYTMTRLKQALEPHKEYFQDLNSPRMVDLTSITNDPGNTMLFMVFFQMAIDPTTEITHEKCFHDFSYQGLNGRLEDSLDEQFSSDGDYAEEVHILQQNDEWLFIINLCK